MQETKRDDLLAGDKNFMQLICENSKPFAYEELMKLASEGKVRRQSISQLACKSNTYRVY